MDKLDLRKQYKELYSPSAKKPSVVDVPDLLYTMIDGVVAAGAGPSESDDFLRAMEAMYGVAYGLKFMSKLRQADPIDFTVMAVEGLWTPASGTMDFGTRQQMDFTLLMLQPDHVTAEMLAAVVADAQERRPNPALENIRLERWQEGLCMQMMHVGPYAEEERTLDALDGFAADNGYRLTGRHHEIYLGDPRRAKPENLKTIVRHPITRE